MSEPIVQWRHLDRWPVFRRMEHRDDCLRRRWDRYSCSCKPGRLREEREYRIRSTARRILAPVVGATVGFTAAHFLALWLLS